MSKCRDTFGEPAIYTPVGGTAIEIDVIMDATFEAVDPNTGTIIISNQPKIGVKIDDLPGEPQKGDLVTVRGIDFRVIEKQTDGQAGTQLLLHKA